MLQSELVTFNNILRMEFSIAFKDLPFEPSEYQVIYVENEFDEEINNYIKENYDFIDKIFDYKGYSFVYLPLYFDDNIKSKIRYTAPYTAGTISNPLSSSYLLNFMSNPDNRVKIGPSLLFSPEQEEEEWVFQGVTLEVPEYNKSVLRYFYQRWFSFRYKDKIKELTDENYFYNLRWTITSYIDTKNDTSARFCLRKDLIYGLYENREENDACCEVEASPKDLKTINQEEIDKILSELQTTVSKLRLKGVALCAIHEFINKQEPISPLVITEDLRLLLPKYNIEIELSPQKKALYFLFLNHPEGIVLQHLENYHKELLNYYKQTNGGELTFKMYEGIKKLETYGNNQINVVITRIKEAFCSKFDEHLACNYLIRGEKGEPYKISLDRELVKWEE